MTLSAVGDDTAGGLVSSFEMSVLEGEFEFELGTCSYLLVNGDVTALQTPCRKVGSERGVAGGGFTAFLFLLFLFRGFLG